MSARPYAQAEPLYKRSLAIYEKALGPGSSRCGQRPEQSGGLYNTQGRYAEAEPLYKRSLAIIEKALGPDHPDVATTLNNLAELYRDRAATPRPSRSTSARWRSGKRRLGPIIPMSRRR